MASLAAETITPPFTLGGAGGRRPGQMIGNILGLAGELHPPEDISAGSFVCGPVGYPDTTGLAAARRFEEAEQGFLFETAQGGLNFDEKSDRGSGGSTATTSTRTAAASCPGRRCAMTLP